jgi:hypothetical protein
MQALSGIFIILHGLVHFWYVVLSYQWVEFKPDMGWNGQSWLFSSFLNQSTIRSITGVLFILAAVAFVISGIGIFIQADWLNTFILGSSIFSTLVLLLFWDGQLEMILQKGILGVLINLVIIAVVLIKG